MSTPNLLKMDRKQLLKIEDEKLELMLGRLLQFGVLLAASVVIVGMAFYLLRNGGERTSYRVFQGEPANLKTLNGVMHDSARLSGRGIIQLGILLLIATPVARVAFSLFAFLREKDYTYTVFTIIVLSLLCFSLFSGFGVR